jgi:hypothetical protein
MALFGLNKIYIALFLPNKSENNSAVFVNSGKKYVGSNDLDFSLCNQTTAGSDMKPQLKRLKI